MSRRLNLAAMVNRAGSRTPSDSPGSTPPSQALAASFPAQLVLEQAHQNKRPRREAFSQDNEKDQLSVRQLQERNRAPSMILPPPPVTTTPSSSELLPVWAPSFQRGDHPINVGDSVGSLETALAQALQLPVDMAKEKESTLEHLERTSTIQKILEVIDRAQPSEAEVLRLTTWEARVCQKPCRTGSDLTEKKKKKKKRRRREIPTLMQQLVFNLDSCNKRKKKRKKQTCRV
ncbi:hypothetical protein RHMOL_Rhmol04G0239500 [Rhododendron molle]|uniref:Uncharacterized protein n=1 Tax=Rhododendron molle TaxID=49168 RepID=A0ACC0P3J3_RHOML|nr:hypothetical protein RHMOL_Rhmol04G0239500 [Rhododendron molle]